MGYGLNIIFTYITQLRGKFQSWSRLNEKKRVKDHVRNHGKPWDYSSYYLFVLKSLKKNESLPGKDKSEDIR